MLNRSASLAMSTSVLKALPGKLDIKRHSPSILYILASTREFSHGRRYNIRKKRIHIPILNKNKGLLYHSILLRAFQGGVCESQPDS